MLSLKASCLLAALALGATLNAFEGVVDYQLSDEGEALPFSYSVKADKVRMDFKKDGEKVSMILGGAKPLTLIHSQKAWLSFQPKGEAQAAKAAKKAKFAKTGRSEKIAGYPAEEWLYEDKDSAYEIWVTDKLGRFKGAPKDQDASAEAWEAALQGKDAFPLKVANRRAGRLFEMTAQKVTPKTLDAALFKAPSNYKEMKMPGAAAGAGAGAQGGAAPDMKALMKKMMDASPEEQERMAQELQRQYGQ